MVNPLQTSTSVNTSTTVSTSSSTTTASTNTSVDTISSASTSSQGLVLLSSGAPSIAKPSLLQVLGTISEANSSNQQQGYATSATINLIQSKFHASIADIANNLLALISQVNKLQVQYQQLANSINQSVSTLNQQIANYNSISSSDTMQTTAMNNAETTYNTALALYQQGAIDAQTYNTALNAYNAQASNYNDYVSKRNTALQNLNNAVSTYNQSVNTYNNQIDQLNVEATKVGLDPLPNLTPVTISATSLTSADIAISGGSPVTITDIVQTSAISTQSTYIIPNLMTVLQNLFNAMLFAVSSLNASINQTSSVRQFLDYYLPVKTTIPSLPPAFVSQVNGSVGSGGASSGGAGGISAMINSLDPVVVRWLLNTNTSNVTFQQFGNALPNNTIDTALLVNAISIVTASLAGGIDIVNLQRRNITGDNLNDNMGKAVALGYIGTVLDIIFKEVLSTSLQQQLNPSGDAQTTANLNGLVGTINLSNIGIALSLLSTTLGNPGLSQQILGLAGLSVSNSISSYSTNPFVQSYAAGQLTAAISGGLSGQDQQAVANAVSATFQGANSSNPSSLLASLSQNLTTAGITGSQAQNVLDSAAAALSQPLFTSQAQFQNGLTQSLQSQGFSPDDANQIASSIAGGAPGPSQDALLNTGNIPSSVLSSSIAYNLSLQGQGTTATFSSIANNVAQSLLQNTQEVSEATFRDQLQFQLEKQGISSAEALRVASGVTLPASALNNPNSQASIHHNIATAAQGILEPVLGTHQAQVAGQKLADQLVGPANTDALDTHNNANATSMVRVIGDHVKGVRTQQNQEAATQVADAFQDYVRPSFDLYTFTQKLVNPGYRLVYENNILNAQPAKTGPIGMGGTNTEVEFQG